VDTCTAPYSSSTRSTPDAYGETFAGVIGKDDLASVLTKLKDAEVMKSPQIGTAQSYLSFRNHALHANWEDVQRESVHSILGFVEQLLLKHFS
jgi:hypothetical protein